ncbi:MAG TPA: lipocalin family protein [Chitinophagaceae bacterium]|nr:lipocalin family protein [Chitinophagaceae bacterium]
MAGMTGRYKIEKVESVSYNTGAAQDRTAVLTTCQRLGIYVFRADSTASYTGTGNCNGTINGRWYLTNSTFYIDFNSGNPGLHNLTALVSWDCTDLVLITRFPTVDSNYRYTLRRF